jgi:hypothetical protein
MCAGIWFGRHQGIETVQSGQRNIHQYHIRAMLLYEAQSGVAVTGFRHNLHSGHVAEERMNPGPH